METGGNKNNNNNGTSKERGSRSGMFIPGVRVHFGTVYTNAHQRLLYNTLRFQLEKIMQAYLFQTHHLHPIYFVFDMSHPNFQL